MPEQEQQSEINFGSAPDPASTPHTASTLWAVQERRFQLSVLILFVASVGVTVLLDMIHENLFHTNANILDTVLRAIVPVFTFVLGIGIKLSRD
jgi:hypothetical protein